MVVVTELLLGKEQDAGAGRHGWVDVQGQLIAAESQGGRSGVPGPFLEDDVAARSSKWAVGRGHLDATGAGRVGLPVVPKAAGVEIVRERPTGVRPGRTEDGLEGIDESIAGVLVEARRAGCRVRSGDQVGPKLGRSERRIGL